MFTDAYISGLGYLCFSTNSLRWKFVTISHLSNCKLRKPQTIFERVCPLHLDSLY